MNGFKFRRQVPIDRYVADFICAELALIVEVDGLTHEMEGRQEKDAERTAVLESLGYSVVRIRNPWIHENPNEVLEHLVCECEMRRQVK